MSDFNVLSKKIVELVGGKNNVLSLTHCITRLRFSLKDAKKFNKKALDNLDGVILAIESNGQYQVVIGDHVSSVYKIITTDLGVHGNAPISEEDASSATEAKGHFLARLFNTMSSIFVPVVPALTGAGMLKALLVILTTYHFLAIDSSSYKILAAASNSVFYFLPIMLAFSSAKTFNAHPFVAAGIVGALLEPNFTKLLVNQGDVTYFLGIPVVLMKYMSTVIPAILSIWVYSHLERLMKRFVHHSIEMVIIPMFGLLIMVPLIAIAIGPLGVFLGNGIANSIAFLTARSGLLTGAIIGGGWTLLVMFGLHWGIVPAMLNNIALHGFDTIKPATATATFSQAGAAFGVFLKSKNKKTKTFALSTMVPALLAGVTEPIVYGISVKYKRPMIAALISATVAGAFVGAMHTTVMAYVFPSLLTLPAFMTSTFLFYTIGIFSAFIMSAGLTYLLGFEEHIEDDGFEEKADEDMLVTSPNGQSLPATLLAAPLKGDIIALTDVKDPVFASESIGKGTAIVPTEGKVYAPLNGVVTKLFQTKHAIGITSDNGIEVLIHVGINTVKLNGELFEAHIKQGDRINTGDLLITFDLGELKARGFDVTTSVIIANTEECDQIMATNRQHVDQTSTLMTVSLSV
ncbi:beta-glucoside-specific PTS transporter subunit IIABC [Brenneria uluponensis]|uniref:beta-glucoside-specific PTS transporter subunit IIABC n=1 Tax=Brenneria uluponensis TaxID=3057057 RepID=UPI0028E39C8E|nr:beta-glucoside-specific PTS transporter subunit IIABC [Brenneria ulupoensis]